MFPMKALKSFTYLKSGYFLFSFRIESIFLRILKFFTEYSELL